MTDVSTVIINDSLSPSLKPFFTPFIQSIDLLSSASKFQYVSLIERIENLKNSNKSLMEKNMKQKQFLYAAKEEIINYKKQVDELNKQVEKQKNVIGNDEMTHDLLSNSFADKIHKQSMQKVVSSRMTSPRMQSPIHQHRPLFFAESTKINEIDNILSPQSRNSTRSITSSRNDATLTLNRLNSSHKRKPSSSLTTNLTSRIIANMKVSPPVTSTTQQFKQPRISKPTLTKFNRTDVSPYFR